MQCIPLKYANCESLWTARTTIGTVLQSFFRSSWTREGTNIPTAIGRISVFCHSRGIDCSLEIRSRGFRFSPGERNLYSNRNSYRAFVANYIVTYMAFIGNVDCFKISRDFKLPSGTPMAQTRIKLKVCNKNRHCEDQYICKENSSSYARFWIPMC